MPNNPIDVDAWMAKQKKTAAPVAATSAIDPDEWMKRQKGTEPQQAPQVVLPTERQQFGYRRTPSLDESLRRSAQVNRGRLQPPRPAATPNDEFGPLYESTQRKSHGVAKNIGIGGSREAESLMSNIDTASDVLAGLATGDTRPLREAGKRLGLSLGRTYLATQPGGGGGQALDQPIAEARRESEARRLSQGDIQFLERNRRGRILSKLEAEDPSLSGRVARGVGAGVVGAAPYLATGGSPLALGLVGAASSLSEPENIPLSTAMAAAPLPIGKAIKPLLQRFRGRGRLPAPEIPQTARLPEPVYPDAPVTQEMPAVRAANAETSADLRMPQPVAAMRLREPISSMPLIEEAPPKPFGVKENLNTGELSPWKSGPGLEEFGYRVPSVKAQQAAQPKTPPLEVVSAVRKAGLLSGIPTHAKNIAGNLTFQPLEEISRIPASITDIAISLANKRRTITGPSAVASGRSFVSAATTGIKEAGQILKRGMTNQQAQALQLGREINSGNKVLDFYVNGVFRTLGAEDAVFRRFALSRAAQDRAKALALTEARQGRIPRSQVSARARQLEQDPSILADAILDSEIATFNNPSLVNRFVQAGMEAVKPYPGGKAVNFGVDLAVPFRNAPSNAVAKLLEYTPLGLLKNGAQVIRAVQAKAFTPEMQRQFSTTMGRTITGSSLILLGYQLGKRGLMTGYNETDPSRRNRDIAAGRTPGAILDPINNQWHSVIGFSPAGPLLVIGATLAREEGRELKDESNRPANLAAALTQTIKEQPLMAGASEISEAISRPGTTSERAGRIAGSFVPTMLSKVGDLTDSQKREAKGFGQQIQRRIPGLRNSLPVAEDALGRPLESRKTAFFDPTMTSSARDKTQTLEAELVRLDVGLSAPKQNKDEGETDQEYRTRKTKAGTWLQAFGEKMIGSRAYQNASKEEQRAAWRKLQQNIHAESDESYPDTAKFDAGGILESVRESAYQKKERLRK